MPLLNEQDREHLRNREPVKCSACGAMVNTEYCRVHDEFYTYGHAPQCADSQEHSVAKCGPRAVSLPENGATYFDPTAFTKVYDQTAEQRAKHWNDNR
jgi:hypothetical protein